MRSQMNSGIRSNPYYHFLSLRKSLEDLERMIEK